MNKKEIREKFRNDCLKRDKNKCCFCKETLNLDVHHITNRNLMPNGGYVKENGITLCHKHHLEAEAYDMSNGKEVVEGMLPEDLYRHIKSSYDLAFEKSNLLK